MHMIFRFTVGVVLAASALGAQAAGFADCTGHFAKGITPKILTQHPGRQRELCFDGFAVLHSGDSKTPVYVAERLTAAGLQNAHLPRTDRFYPEARLPFAERAQLADYKNVDAAGRRYDRGHNAPAADSSTPEAMAQSFSLANILPQAPQMNRGIWAKSVEKAVRQYAMRAGEVYVLTGPVYTNPVATLGQVWIPSQMFKLVYDPARRQAWAYWVDNTDDARMSSPITYQELVRRTGIEFLPGGV